MKPDRASLDAAIPHILSAPKDKAPIEMLCNRPDFRERNFTDRLNATVEGGIENCRFLKAPWLTLEDGSGDPRIQVSILPRRTLDLVWSENDDAPHPGDTFIVDMDLTEENLPVGTRLQAGSAVLEVSDYWNNACTKWKVRYGSDALDWVREPANIPLRLRGILCKIVKDGVIENGAKLTKIID